MAPELEEIEVQILVALQENPRISISELSTKVKASRPTIIKTLTAMMEENKLLISSGVNARTNDCRLANVGINVSTPAARSRIIDVLQKCPKVLNIYRTTDQANLLITLCGVDEKSITSTINCIGDLENVEVKYSQSLGVPLKDLIIPISVGDNSRTACGRNCDECMSRQNSWCSGCYTFTE
ncbi:winged helix-turn-helix transcriptional regulator [Candidatus Bathyarchaeota archaeon]|nr:winged helix-turn-helix transcriptional regulator [Candidatus Bathyarchaeota archaeon]